MSETATLRRSSTSDGAGQYAEWVDIDDYETHEFSDDDEAEWAEIAEESLSTEQLDRVADYLRKTGQASA